MTGGQAEMPGAGLPTEAERVESYRRTAGVVRQLASQVPAGHEAARLRAIVRHFEELARSLDPDWRRDRAVNAERERRRRRAAQAEAEINTARQDVA